MYSFHTIEVALDIKQLYIYEQELIYILEPRKSKFTTLILTLKSIMNC